LAAAANGRSPFHALIDADKLPNPKRTFTHNAANCGFPPQSDYRLQRCFATQALSASAIAPLWLFNGQLVEVAFAAID
jgi:hypothetical protein